MQKIYTYRIAHFCLLVFSICLCFSILPAQNWHPLPSSGPLLYSFQQQGSTDEWYFAAKADSVRLEGADSAFYLYRIDRPVFPADQLATCQGDSLQWFPGSIAISRDHYLGKKMLLRPNGECVFVSSNADSFLLKTLAQSGQSWTWKPGITATVDSVVAGTVLGSADSLKYISLSSGKSIVLSKAHGMVGCFAFLPFLNWQHQPDVVDFTIWGIPGLGLGGHFPNYEELFSFDVNDKFGYRQRDFFPQGSGTALESVVIQAVQPGMRFAYDVVSERLTILALIGFPIDSTYTPPFSATTTSDSTSYPLIPLLPYETHDPLDVEANEYYQDGIRLLSGSNGRLRLDIARQTYYDACANAYVPFEPVWTLSLAAGLGKIYSTYSDVGQNTLFEMYCYQKGAETWGTCLDLSTLIAIDPAQETTFQLAPNPASSQVRIQLAEAGAATHAITLLSLSGQVVMQHTLPAQQSAIDLDISTIPAGMYLLQVTDADQATGHRKLVIAR
jgi:Secretion system C-terminal sorting domain